MTISTLIILGIIFTLSFGFGTVSAQENNTQDFGFSVETDEGLISELSTILPYLVIVIVGIIIGIFVILRKIINKDVLDDDFDDDSGETYFESPDIPEIKTGTEPDDSNTLDPEYLIQNKVRLISKLQENSIGDYERLEKIKKDLIDFGSFTKEDNDYLEEQFAEYEKISKPED